MMSDSVISYAALILADAGLDVSSDNLLALTNAAGASVDKVWADIFSKALEGKDIKQVLSGFHAVGSSGSTSSAGAASVSEVVEEVVEEAAEESDDDMGFGLFD